MVLLAQCYVNWNLSRTSIKRPLIKWPASIKRPFYKVRNFVIELLYSIPLVNGIFLTLLSRPQIMVTGKRKYEQQPCRDRTHRRSTIALQNRQIILAYF